MSVPNVHAIQKPQGPEECRSPRSSMDVLRRIQHLEVSSWAEVESLFLGHMCHFVTWPTTDSDSKFSTFLERSWNFHGHWDTMGHHLHIEVQPALRALHPFAKLLGVHYSVTRVIVSRCPEGCQKAMQMNYDEVWWNMILPQTCWQFYHAICKHTEFWWARLALLAFVDLLAGRPRLRDTDLRCKMRNDMRQYASTCAPLISCSHRYAWMCIDIHSARR